MEQLYWLIQKVYGQSNQQHVAGGMFARQSENGTN